MDDFVKAATKRRAGSITIADHAEIRENAAIVPIGNTTRARVNAVRSSPSEPRSNSEPAAVAIDIRKRRLTVVE
jgi:hypothetical protein